MKSFICFALFIAAASASVIPIGGGPFATSISGQLPIGLGGFPPLGLGLAQQQLLVNSPLGLGLGPNKIVGGALPLNAGLLGLGALPLNAGLGLGNLQLGAPWGLGLGSQLISPIKGGLIIKK